MCSRCFVIDPPRARRPRMRAWPARLFTPGRSSMPDATSTPIGATVRIASPTLAASGRRRADSARGGDRGGARPVDRLARAAVPHGIVCVEHSIVARRHVPRSRRRRCRATRASQQLALEAVAADVVDAVQLRDADARCRPRLRSRRRRRVERTRRRASMLRGSIAHQRRELRRGRTAAGSPATARSRRRRRRARRRLRHPPSRVMPQNLMNGHALGSHLACRRSSAAQRLRRDLAAVMKRSPIRNAR